MGFSQHFQTHPKKPSGRKLPVVFACSDALGLHWYRLALALPRCLESESEQGWDLSWGDTDAFVTCAKLDVWSLVFLSCSTSFSLSFSRFFPGFSQVFPMFFQVFPRCFPCFSQVFPMFFHVFPMFFPMFFPRFFPCFSAHPMDHLWIKWQPCGEFVRCKGHGGHGMLPGHGF